MADGTQATGLKGFLENLSPAQLAAIGQAGNAILGASMPFMDPTQPGRAFSTGLAGIPQAYQQAQAAELKRRQGEISVRQAEAQERAISGLKDFFGRQVQAPTARTLPNAGPPGTTIPAAPGSTAQTIVPGERKTGPEEEMLGLLAQAYPEVFAQQYMSQLFAKPGERYSDPIEIDKHLYQRNLTTGQLERITPSAGVTVNTGPGWVEKGFMPVDPADPSKGVTPVPGGSRDPAYRATESEKKGALFFDQMETANKLMDEVIAGGFDPGSRIEHGRGAMPFNVATPEFRQYDSAAYAWSEAFLRLKTGAQANETEVTQQQENLFPRAGDDAETIAFKRRLRARLQNTMDKYSAASRRGREAGLSESDRKRMSDELDIILQAVPGNQKKRPPEIQRLYDEYGLED